MSDAAASTEHADPTRRVPIYPHSGVCAYCERERDDLFWHVQDTKFYCADVMRCEARAAVRRTGAYA